MCKTNITILQDLLKAWERGYSNGSILPGICNETFASLLDEAADTCESEKALRDFRDAAVLYLGSRQTNKDIAWDLMSALTYTIDKHLFMAGYEV